MSAVGACKTIGDKGGYQSYLRAHCEVNGSGRDCRVIGLSSHGLFVESFVPAVTGSRVALRVQLPNGHQVCTTGVVNHHEFMRGFGVDFTNLSSYDREQISSLAG